MSGVVTVTDAAGLGYCRKGIRAFAERHGFDYMEFLKQGIPIDLLSAVDDEMVKAVIAVALKREENNEQ